MKTLIVILCLSMPAYAAIRWAFTPSSPTTEGQILLNKLDEDDSKWYVSSYELVQTNDVGISLHVRPGIRWAHIEQQQKMGMGKKGYSGIQHCDFDYQFSYSDLILINRKIKEIQKRRIK